METNMSWLNPITWFKTSEKAADGALSIIDGVKSGLDALILTEEEKIQYGQKGFDLQLQFLKLNMDQNSLRSKARRELAKAIVYFNLFMITVIGILWKIDPLWSKFLMELMIGMKLGVAFVAIIVFYFGYYGVQGIISKAKK
jgi:hypothetical protein